MDHEKFMRRALTLARKGLGSTSPNPAVGSVIVKDGRIIAQGYHKKAGGPHAEIEALKNVKEGLEGAVLYVTLEPCCHFGRTPPCVDAIIRSGIKKVVAGMCDPNPLVSGKGMEKLEKAGVEVTAGVLEEECRRLNEAYIKHVTTGMPFVTLKLASTIDGRTATSTGESKWITGLDSRKAVHRLRALQDVVMVGGNTVAKDDPELTVRLVKGRNPKKAVIDSNLKISPKAKVFHGGDLFIFTTSKADNRKKEKLKAAGVEVVTMPEGPGGVDVKRVLKALGRMGVTSVLVEGGSTLAASLLKKGLADKLMIFIAPMIIGGDGLPSVGGLGIGAIGKALRLNGMNVSRSGGDVLLEGYLR